jgi:hypothetical protein
MMLPEIRSYPVLAAGLGNCFHSSNLPAESPTSLPDYASLALLRPMLPPRSEVPILHLAGVQF